MSVIKDLMRIHYDKLIENLIISVTGYFKITTGTMTDNVIPRHIQRFQEFHTIFETLVAYTYTNTT